MNDGRPQRVGLSSNNKTPIDDIIEHITADLQSYEGQYILLGQPTSNSSSRTIWHQFNGSGNSQPTEPQNYRLNNFTYDNGRSNDLGMEPRMMYTENTFVDMSNSGFVPYLISPTNQYTTSHHDPHMNYLYYQRHSSSSVADEYGLFDTGNLGRREQSILQNLRTNWPSSNQEAYNNTSFNDMNVEPMDIDSSPQFYFREQQNNSQLFQAQQHQQSSNLQSQQCLLFQQSPQREQHGQRQPLFQQQHPLHQQEQSIFQQQQSLSQHSSSPVGNFQTVPKKPRMVAEVRPMRPTYSDVLAKSVTSTSSQTNGCITKSMKNAKLDVSRTMNNVVPKPKKASAGVKNGNVILKRQHSNGSSEEQLLNGSGKCNNVEKKSRSANGSIHWSSLEDLEQNSSNGDLNESSRQKSSFSSNTVNNKGKKNVRKQKINHQNSEHEYSSRKVINNDDRMHGRKSAKKSNSQITNNNSTQWETGKTATSSPLRTDKKQPNKAITVDSSSAKKATKSSGIIDGVENQKSSIVNNKNARFNISNTSIPKKSPRVVKRRASPSQFGLFWKRWCKKSEEYLLLFINWFVNLLWDVIAMSFRLFFHLLGVSMCCGLTWFRTSKSIFGKMYTNPWNWWKEVKNCKHPSGKKASNRADNAYSIPANIPLPATGEEAMKRLLACKGKDAYSILGVTKTCSDDVIKRYYKRQAVLVHPDKNNQPGAEEAFKILVHAFDLIGEPEKRKAYDRCSLETPQMDKVWGEFSSLLVQLHKKMEYAANTIRCTNCGQRHRRVKIERPLYAARFCSQCKIHHSSREGDIWAESLFMGWIWKYYACMDGAVYDISDWAACQSENLRHLKPNMHVVQYRIVVGKNRQSAYQPPAPPTNYSEPDLDDFLSSLYGQSTSGGAGGGNCNPANDLNSRIRKKSKKKTK